MMSLTEMKEEWSHTHLITLSCVMHRHIPKAEKEIALRMSLDSGLSNTEIAKYTGICPRTMRALLKQYKETGEVVKKPVVSGRPRLLNSLDATVSLLQVKVLHVSSSFTVY